MPRSTQFNVDYQVTLLVVIWALGWAMVALAALVWLPVPAVLAVGLAMIAGHNLLDGVRSANPLWVILHAQGFVVNRPGFVVFVAYPLIPWIGVTAVGYALGQVYRWEAERRRAFLLRCGLAMTAAFVILRVINQYGDPVPWASQASGALTLVSFLNLTKYPAVAAVPADDARTGALDPACAGRGRHRSARLWSSDACRSSTSSCT